MATFDTETTIDAPVEKVWNALADIRFYLRPDGDQTVVTVSPEYRLKYGPLGSLMDRFYVRGTYEKGMDNLLQGLKDYVENTE